MAKKTVEKFFSDLSGTEIETPGPTVAFSFDGVSYLVDLTEKERQAFNDAVAPYIAVGRRATGRARNAASTSTGPDAKVVRAWAQDEGLDVPARGRIPAAVLEAYKAAH